MEGKVKPITPNEVAKQQKETFPGEVIEAFNELIAENFVGGSATVTQKEAVARMVAKGLNRGHIYDKGWLNVEEMYEKSGWKVVYDKPGWDESYEPFFRFTRKRGQ